MSVPKIPGKSVCERKTVACFGKFGVGVLLLWALTPIERHKFSHSLNACARKTVNLRFGPFDYVSQPNDLVLA